MEKDIGP